MSGSELDVDTEFILPYIQAVEVDLSESEVEQVVKKCKKKIIRDISTVPQEEYHMKFFSDKISYVDDNMKRQSKKHCTIILSIC